MLNRNLDWLRQAIAYPNISAAARQIGLSQPQLSRIVAQVEEQFDMILLDRGSKRNATWTPEAFKLIEIYGEAEQGLRRRAEALQNGEEPRKLRIGCLEGLLTLGSAVGNELLQVLGTKILSLDVLDLHDLELSFGKGDLDIILSSRKAPKIECGTLAVGFQFLKTESASGAFRVLSAFEYSTLAPSDVDDLKGKVLVSNSLSVRRHWLSKYGGTGTLPSPVLASPPKAGGAQQVLLLYRETLPRVVLDKLDPMLSAVRKSYFQS